ncbi:MAG: sigma-70 family RNA polymerase sigma factor [Bacteroidota bacterium]
MYKKKHIVSEDDLIALLKSKQANAMSILYDNYSTALFGVINRIIENDEAAEDILQETFIKIWKNFDQFDVSKGKLFTWMLNIARNLAIDATRSKNFSNTSKNQSIENIVHVVDKENSASTNTETIGLKKLVDGLDDEHQRIIDLMYFGGYSQSEVAKKLDIPLGTVKTRARNAILTLRKKFL